MDRDVGKQIIALLDREGIKHTDINNYRLQYIFVLCMRQMKEGRELREKCDTYLTKNR